jgi:hypothetical protein
MLKRYSFLLKPFYPCFNLPDSSPHLSGMLYSLFITSVVKGLRCQTHNHGSCS